MTRVSADCDCGGKLIVDDPDVDIWIAECDSCGEVTAVHRSKADPRIRRALRMQQAGFPDEFVSRAFDDDAHNQSVAFACRAWVADYAAWRTEHAADMRRGNDVPAPPPAPALYGEVGRGKSHLLVAIGRLVIRECDAPVLFRSARQLLRELQRFDDDVQRGESWKRAVTVDVLLLDDLGAQQVTEWKLDQIADLIDERYQRRLPTIVATNYPPAMWGELVVDERTASRLKGMTVQLELPGPDRRQTQLIDTPIITRNPGGPQ